MLAGMQSRHVVFALAAISAVALLSACGYAPPPAPLPRPAGSGFRVMSYNIVHGTRAPVPPFLVPRARVERTLGRIANVVNDESVDLVALQESDGGRALDRARRLGAGT